MGFPQRILPIALLAACATPLCAQSADIGIFVPAPSHPSTKAAQATGSVTGTILCSDTRRPARGAMVMVDPLPITDKDPAGPATRGTARVAMDGTYTVANLDPGEYSVTAILPGYLSIMDEIGSIGTQEKPNLDRIREIMKRNGTIVVAAGSAATFDITLQRGAGVSGHVLYADGSPATQITVQLEDINAKPAPADTTDQQDLTTVLQFFVSHQTPYTDDQGRFRLAGIKPGSYRVVAVQPSPSPSDTDAGGFRAIMGISADAAALRIYSGDTLHQKSAKVYELRPGDELPGIDITIPLNIFHRVHGTLTAKDGRPVNTASLTLTDNADDAFKFTASVNEDGSFTFDTVPAGAYTLAASKATIVEPSENSPPGMSTRYGPHKTTAAFADGTTPILVKDSNLDDVTFTLTEVPLPPDAEKPTPSLPAVTPD